MLNLKKVFRKVVVNEIVDILEKQAGLALRRLSTAQFTTIFFYNASVKPKAVPWLENI